MMKPLSRRRLKKLYNENKMNFSRILKSKYFETYSYIDSLYNDNTTNKFTEKIYKYVYPNSGKCKVCKKQTSFRSFGDGFLNFCGQSCQQTFTAAKYGVKNLFQSPLIKNRIKETNLKKYGVENPLKNDDILKKCKQTKKEKYGNENFNNSDKAKITFLKTYGVDNPNKLKQIRDKIKTTNLKKYGVEYPTQNKNVIDKTKQTNLKKYGVIHFCKNAELYEKHLKKSFKLKEYKTKTGKTFLYQGYENFALDILLNEYKEFDIITNKSEMPKFIYFINDIQHRYYPDIFIKSKNIIIEVKSEWTNKLHKKIDKLKKQCVIDRGFEFKKFIFSKTGELINE